MAFAIMTPAIPVAPAQDAIQPIPVIQIAQVQPVKSINKYGMDMELEKKIKEKFGKDGDLMVAIALAESGGSKTNAVGYNCWVNGRSTPCTKESRVNAWSVDCGTFQVNVKGNKCPEELFDPQENIDRAYKIYRSQGLGAWWAYKNGLYKKYLDYDSVVTVVDVL
jgi:hypothetical protein